MRLGCVPLEPPLRNPLPNRRGVDLRLILQKSILCLSSSKLVLGEGLIQHDAGIRNQLSQWS